MPAPPWKQSHYPGKTYTLRAAAEHGQLLVLRCNLCHRAVTFLASDLIRVLDPDRDALQPPFRCSSCGEIHFLRVTLRLPEAGDWGHLVIRRPGPIIHTQTWRNVRLGD